MRPFSTAKIAEARQPSLESAGSMTALIALHQHNGLMTRRRIIVGAAACFITAPAIVRIGGLMPVRRLPPPIGRQFAGYCERLMYQALEANLKSGRMSTVLNGKIILEADARRLVARAQDYGWLPPYISIYRNA